MISFNAEAGEALDDLLENWRAKGYVFDALFEDNTEQPVKIRGLHARRSGTLQLIEFDPATSCEVGEPYWATFFFEDSGGGVKLIKDLRVC